MKFNLPSLTKPAIAVLLGLALQTGVTRASDAPDLDGDGIPNLLDSDIDNDGIPNSLDDNVDGGIALTGPYAGQYIGDHSLNSAPEETDIDDDGLADDSLAETDIDGDGVPDTSALEADIDGDGRLDTSASERDIDGDGSLDNADNEEDIDGDGLDDDDAMETDIDGDASPDTADTDEDGDGLDNASAAELDTDGDGLTNDSAEESDDDGDGVEDINDDDDDNDGVGDLDDADHHSESGEEETEIELTATAAAAEDSEVKLKLELLGSGSGRLEIEAKKLAIGTYDIVVGGIAHGTIVAVTAEDEIKVRFQTGATGGNPLPLDFAIAGQTVEISQTNLVTGITTVFFTTTAPAPTTGGNTGGIGHGEFNLTAGELTPSNAVAKAEIEFGRSGAKEFQIALNGLPVGDYSLIIGDTVRGTITVAAGIQGNRGKLKFNVSPDAEDNELPLDFAIASQPIAIVQGDVTLFFGELPAAPTPTVPPLL